MECGFLLRQLWSAQEESVRGDRRIFHEDGNRRHGDVPHPACPGMEIGLSRRDTRLRTGALFGPRLSRAAATVGARLDADPAEAKPADLPRALASTAYRVPVLDGDVPG